MIEHLLHGSPVSSAGIELICAVLGDIAARWPEGRPLRVLEIGADGGLTRRALDRLAQSGAAFRYAATSPDAEQAARLGFAVSAAPGASAACWRRASRPTLSATTASTSSSRRMPAPGCGSTRQPCPRCAICWFRAV